ncbi:MAG: hypothetical protein ACL93V_09915 [Candidatus Electrothrix sp. YB6]
MKVVDGHSRMGQKLEKWLSQDGKSSDQKSSEEHPQKRNHLPGSDEPVTRLEKKIEKWFTAAEEDDRPFIVEERLGTYRHKILVMTYYRAILFESGRFRKLKDVSDKVWRQFVSVHLTEKTFYSSLELRFFPYHDSVSYHNPFKENSALKEDDFQHWQLDRLNKEEARRAYAFLKDKEIFWQEKRRQEHIEQYKALNARPPGGGAPPKKKD